MKFRSPTEHPIRVALLSGHTALIGPDWRELATHFHRDALAKGAQCDADRIENPAPAPIQPSDTAASTIDELGEYRKAIQSMLEREQEGDFVASTGLPNLKAVGKLVGFQVDREKVYEAFREMTKEAEAEAPAAESEAE